MSSPEGAAVGNKGGSASAAAAEKKLFVSKRDKNSEEYKNYMAAKLFTYLCRVKVTKLYQRVYPLCEHLFRDHVHKKGQLAFRDGDEAYDCLSIAPETKVSQYDLQCVYDLWGEEEMTPRMFRALYRTWMTRNVERSEKCHVQLLLYRLPNRDQSKLYSPSDSEGDSESEYENIAGLEVKVSSRKTKDQRKAARKDVVNAASLLDYVQRKKAWKKGCRPDPVWTNSRINYTMLDAAKKSWEAERAAHHGLTEQVRQIHEKMEAEGDVSAGNVVLGVKRSLQMKVSKQKFMGVRNERKFLEIMKERDAHDKRDMRDIAVEDLGEVDWCGEKLREAGWQPDYVYHVASLSGEQAAASLKAKRRIVIDEDLCDLRNDAVCSYVRTFELAKGIAEDMAWRTKPETEDPNANKKKKKQDDVGFFDDDDDETKDKLLELPEELEKVPCRTLALVLPDKYCVYLSTLFTLDSKETPHLFPGDVACYKTLFPLHCYTDGVLWHQILYGASFPGEVSMLKKQQKREIVYPESCFLYRKQKMVEFPRIDIDTPQEPGDAYCEDHHWFPTRELWTRTIGPQLNWDGDTPKYALNAAHDVAEKQAGMLATFQKDPKRHFRFWMFAPMDHKMAVKCIGEADRFLDLRAEAEAAAAATPAENSSKKKKDKSPKKDDRKGKKGAKGGKKIPGARLPDPEEHLGNFLG